MNIEIDAIDINDDNFINICNILEKDIVIENLSINGGTLNYTHLTYDSDILLVARDGSKIVGFASLVGFGNTIYVYQIAVKKEYQGNGIGSMLITKTIELAKDVDMDVTAHVMNYNTNSQKLFLGLNFLKLGESEEGNGFYRFYQNKKSIGSK